MRCFAADRVMKRKPSHGLLGRFARDEAGTTAIEYAIIALIVSLGVLVGATGIGTTLSDFFNRANDGFSG
ncbi:MAG: Flp family type IVb pilin [Hyphomicrobiaceae bacterium]|jgi:Flp pilus assembly pilin Flp